MSAALSRTAIDFDAVAALALANARVLLPRWFPMGRARGRNFCVGALDGGRGKSLCISTANGQWIDFARPSDRGCDLTALNAAPPRAASGGGQRHLRPARHRAAAEGRRHDPAHRPDAAPLRRAATAARAGA